MVEFKNKVVTCRKPHGCSWCGESIDAGSLAVYRAGVFEGDFYALYDHMECDIAMGKSDFDEYSFGDQQRGTVMGEEK